MRSTTTEEHAGNLNEPKSHSHQDTPREDDRSSSRPSWDTFGRGKWPLRAPGRPALVGEGAWLENSNVGRGNENKAAATRNAPTKGFPGQKRAKRKCQPWPRTGGRHGVPYIHPMDGGPRLGRGNQFTTCRRVDRSRPRTCRIDLIL